MLSVLRISAALFLLLPLLAGAAPRKESLGKTYRDWLNGPASYLITKDEKQSFANLSSDLARDEFIQQFWQLRAAPGASAAAFREEFFRRVAYADATYGNDAGSDGWRTDRGRAYILFGAPQTKSNFQFNQELYPTEMWFYQNPGLRELPPFFYLLFFDRDGVGGYRLYHPYTDGPDKITRSGQTKQQAYNYLKNINVELAHTTLTLIPGEPVDTETFSGSMESSQVLNALKGYSEMPSYVRAIAERRRALERVTTKVQFDVPVTSLLTFVSFEKTEPWLNYQLEVNDPTQAKAVGGAIAYKVTARLFSGERLIFERTDSPNFVIDPAKSDALKARPLLFEDKIPVVPNHALPGAATPGKYRLSLSVVNDAAKRTYEASSEFTVAAPGPFSMGAVMVSARHASEPRDRAFVFEGVKFTPNQSRRVDPADGLSIFYQFSDNLLSTELLPVEYVIGSMNGSFRKTFEDKLDPRQANAFGSLLVSKLLPLAEIQQGSYQLAIRIRDPQSGKVAASSVAFTVTSNEEHSTPIVISQARPGTLQAKAVSQYERALCFLSQGLEPEATRALENSWSMFPNPAIRPLLNHLHQRAGTGANTLHKDSSPQTK